MFRRTFLSPTSGNGVATLAKIRHMKRSGDYVSLLPDAVGSVALRDAGSELDFMVAATPEPQARYFGA